MSEDRDHPATRGSQLPRGTRVLLSLVGGLLAIGIIESAATVYSLLRFGLGGTQNTSFVYGASAIAACMFLASLLATSAVVGSSVGPHAWPIERGLYFPMLLIALAIYAAMLLGGIGLDPTSLCGELLIEKKLSVSVYAALTVAAALIVVLRGGASRIRT